MAFKTSKMYHVLDVWIVENDIFTHTWISHIPGNYFFAYWHFGMNAKFSFECCIKSTEKNRTIIKLIIIVLDITETVNTG